MSWTTDHEFGEDGPMEYFSDEFLDLRRADLVRAHHVVRCYCQECRAHPESATLGEFVYTMVMN